MLTLKRIRNDESAVFTWTQADCYSYCSSLNYTYHLGLCCNVLQDLVSRCYEVLLSVRSTAFSWSYLLDCDHLSCNQALPEVLTSVLTIKYVGESVYVLFII